MIDIFINMKNQKNIAAFPAYVLQTLREMGEFISCARKEKGWTQEALATRIGVNRMTIVRIEKGRPEVATGWYMTAAWLLGLQVFTWQTIGEARSDSVVGDLLIKLKKTLPSTVRQKRKKIENDF